MEQDMILKNYLQHDEIINKIESELSLDYINCKLKNCYSNNENSISNTVKITHEDYEKCKSNCMSRLNKFNLKKKVIYQDFTKFYYEKFLTCSDITDLDKYDDCIINIKRNMYSSIAEIRNLFNKY